MWYQLIIITIKFSSNAIPIFMCFILHLQKGLVLGVYEGENDEPCLTPAAQKFNDHLGGKLFDLCQM